MNLTNPSKLILDHKKIFLNKKILFSGNIQDSLPEILQTKKSIIHIQKYNFLKFIKKIKKKNIFLNFLIKKKMIKKCNTIIYFFSKDKKEVYFQLKKILSLAKKKKIFVVGENKSGIKSFMNFFRKEINFKKFLYGKKSIIYYKKINHKLLFNLKSYYKINYWKNIPIKFLPGVFGYKKIDSGSELLISTFYKYRFFNKKVLDLCSGSGILSIAIQSIMQNNEITLSESCLTSLSCCKKTFLLNKIKIHVKRSDIYSNIKEKFNVIISNPPVHNNFKKTNYFIKKIIFESKFYLKPNGELRIVSNNSISCLKYFKKNFQKYRVLKKNKNFTVYQGFK
ncbi:methyltransferase [Buchnera aphidicola]|uniref:methyltransferase n=1 Tax=Buchnera aphidicola TaxID=9 RepID=UPI002543C303|nr:methyltransferase [Buchnera aphidicola]WII23507.1 methyltransferase [Buchnera aphidicola (Sipha maydis)]